MYVVWYDTKNVDKWVYFLWYTANIHNYLSVCNALLIGSGLVAAVLLVVNCETGEVSCQKKFDD